MVRPGSLVVSYISTMVQKRRQRRKKLEENDITRAKKDKNENKETSKICVIIRRLLRSLLLVHLGSFS